MPADDSANIITLKTYMDMRIEELETRLSDHLIALQHRFDDRMSSQFDRFEERSRFAEIAINKSESSIDKRLEAMNEFRDQLNSQAALFVTESKLGATTETVNARIDIVFQTAIAKADAIRSERDTKFDAVEAMVQSSMRERDVKIESLQRNVYILLGGLAAVQFLFSFLMKN